MKAEDLESLVKMLVSKFEGEEQDGLVLELILDNGIVKELPYNGTIGHAHGCLVYSENSKKVGGILISSIIGVNVKEWY